MFGRHSQFLNELFDMLDLIFRYVPIYLGQFPHQNENSFKKNCLALTFAERVDAAHAISAKTVNHAPQEIADECS